MKRFLFVAAVVGVAASVCAQEAGGIFACNDKPWACLRGTLTQDDFSLRHLKMGAMAPYPWSSKDIKAYAPTLPDGGSVGLLGLQFISFAMPRSLPLLLSSSLRPAAAGRLEEYGFTIGLSPAQQEIREFETGELALKVGIADIGRYGAIYIGLRNATTDRFLGMYHGKGSDGLYIGTFKSARVPAYVGALPDTWRYFFDPGLRFCGLDPMASSTFEVWVGYGYITPEQQVMIDMIRSPRDYPQQQLDPVVVKQLTDAIARLDAMAADPSMKNSGVLGGTNVVMDMSKIPAPPQSTPAGVSAMTTKAVTLLQQMQAEATDPAVKAAYGQQITQMRSIAEKVAQYSAGMTTSIDKSQETSPSVLKSLDDARVAIAPTIQAMKPPVGQVDYAAQAQKLRDALSAMTKGVADANLALAEAKKRHEEGKTKLRSLSDDEFYDIYRSQTMIDRNLYWKVITKACPEQVLPISAGNS